jgi:hypothetical protein
MQIISPPPPPRRRPGTIPRWLPGRLPTGSARPLPLWRRPGYSPPAAPSPPSTAATPMALPARRPRDPLLADESFPTRRAHGLPAAPVATCHGSGAFTAGVVLPPAESSRGPDLPPRQPALSGAVPHPATCGASSPAICASSAPCPYCRSNDSIELCSF